MIGSFIKATFKSIVVILCLCACVLVRMVLAFFISPRSGPSFAERPKRPLHEPLDFGQCRRLQALLIQIQRHILGSITTQHCFAAVCGRIDHELQNGTPLVNVSVDDVKAHFSSKWPKFVSLNPDCMKYKDEVRGRVDKGYNDVNEIELDPDLVRVVEAAPEASDLLVYLMMLLIVTTFHELMHHLTKSVFNLQLTPPGTGDSPIVEEAGIELEEMLFAGIVCAFWDKGETAEMEKIRCLALDYRGHLRDLPADKCQHFINSIYTPRLAQFQFSKLKTHINKPGSECRRINSPMPRTEPHLPPAMVVSRRCHGLGINNTDNITISDKHIM